MTDAYGVRHPGRREAGVAIAVALLLVLVSWLASRVGDDSSGGGLTSVASSPDDPVVAIDQPGQVTTAQAIACLQNGTTLYSSVQQTATGATAVVIRRGEDGELRLCDSSGQDSPSVAAVELADAADPVRLLSNGRQSWECEGDRLTSFQISHWLSVAAPVDRVQLRFLVDRVAGPWFSARAIDGFVHAHAWLGEQGSGAVVQVQTRVLDAGGATVAQDALPAGPQPVTGCQGGDVEIG